MTQYVFGSVLYDTSRKYHAAIAQEWLSANGLNSRKFVRESFNSCTDAELADEAVEAWDLLAPKDEERDWETGELVEIPSDVSREALIQAFADYRATVASSHVEEDEASNRTLWS